MSHTGAKTASWNVGLYRKNNKWSLLVAQCPTSCSLRMLNIIWESQRGGKGHLRNGTSWSGGARRKGGGRGAVNLCTLTLLQQVAQHKSLHSTNKSKDSRIHYFLQFLPRHQISDFSTFSSWVETLKLENNRMFVMHTQVSCTNVCVSYHVCNAHTSILH